MSKKKVTYTQIFTERVVLEFNHERSFSFYHHSDEGEGFKLFLNYYAPELNANLLTTRSLIFLEHQFFYHFARKHMTLKHLNQKLENLMQKVAKRFQRLPVRL